MHYLFCSVWFSVKYLTNKLVHNSIIVRPYVFQICLKLNSAFIRAEVIAAGLFIFCTQSIQCPNLTLTKKIIGMQTARKCQGQKALANTIVRIQVMKTIRQHKWKPDTQAVMVCSSWQLSFLWHYFFGTACFCRSWIYSAPDIWDDERFCAHNWEKDAAVEFINSSSIFQCVWSWFVCICYTTVGS